MGLSVLKTAKSWVNLDELVTLLPTSQVHRRFRRKPRKTQFLSWSTFSREDSSEARNLSQLSKTGGFRTLALPQGHGHEDISLRMLEYTRMY